MNQKITLLAYLALLTTILLDSGRVVIAQTFDWTNDETMTLSKLATANDCTINRRDSNTFKVSETNSNYLETFIIKPQNQTIQMKSSNDNVFIDKSKSEMSLESGPQRVLKVTSRYSRNALIKNERGSLSAYYDHSVIDHSKESAKVEFNRGNLHFDTKTISIFYDRFAKMVNIKCGNEFAKFSLVPRSQKGRIELIYGEISAWKSYNRSIVFGKNVAKIVCDDVRLTINLPHKPYGLVLNSLHANLTGAPTKVTLDCDVGTATMELTEEEKAKKIVLASNVDLKPEQGRIELYNNRLLIRGPQDRVIIRKSPKLATTLWLKTMLASLKVYRKI